MKGSTTTVTRLPACDFCTATATVDGKTKFGPWANMCDGCFKTNGVGLGVGKGQRYEVEAPEMLVVGLDWNVPAVANDL